MYYTMGPLSDCRLGLGNLVKCIHMGFRVSNAKAWRLVGYREKASELNRNREYAMEYTRPHANLKLMVVEIYFS